MIDSKLNNFIYETPMYDEDCELLKNMQKSRFNL